MLFTFLLYLEIYTQPKKIEDIVKRIQNQLDQIISKKDNIEPHQIL